jgi:hypothetical protein
MAPNNPGFFVYHGREVWIDYQRGILTPGFSLRKSCKAIAKQTSVRKSLDKKDGKSAIVMVHITMFGFF